MDDLSGKISELLSDPDTMEQIMNLTGMLSGGSNVNDGKSVSKEPALPPPKPEQKEESSLPALSPDTMQTVMRIMPLLGKMNQEDDTSRLLKSLRPFLGESRRNKLDEATKILQLLKILPVIKQLNL